MPIYTLAHLVIMLFFAFIIGASIGSFLNVCMLRIPRKISLSFPGSHCFSCGTPLGITENIPIFGYFILKGKCKHCGSTFSFQYAWVEIITALFSVIAFIVSLQTTNSFNPMVFVSQLIFFSILLVAAVIDLKNEIIPDQITIPFFIFFVLIHHFYRFSLSNDNQNSFDIFINRPSITISLLLVFSIYYCISHIESSADILTKINAALLFLLTITIFSLPYTIGNNSPYYLSCMNSLLGALFCGGFLYILTLPFKIFNFPDFLGEGDIKLFLAIGAFFGGFNSYKILIVWLYITAIFASILVFWQAAKKLSNKTEKLAGGIFLFIMIIGLSLIAIAQTITPNKFIFLSGVILFLSTSYCFFLLAKKWSDQKIVSKGFPMAPFIMLATLAFLFTQNQFNEKLLLFFKIF